MIFRQIIVGFALVALASSGGGSWRSEDKRQVAFQFLGSIQAKISLFYKELEENLKRSSVAVRLQRCRLYKQNPFKHQSVELLVRKLDKLGGAKHFVADFSFQNRHFFTEFLE